VLVGIEFALDDREIACRKGDDRLSIEDVILNASEHDELQNDLQNMRYEFLRHVDFDEYLQKNAHGVT